MSDAVASINAKLPPELVLDNEFQRRLKYIIDRVYYVGFDEGIDYGWEHPRKKIEELK